MKIITIAILLGLLGSACATAPYQPHEERVEAGDGVGPGGEGATE